MTQIPDRLRNQVGDEAFAAGDMIYKRGGVRLMEQTGSLLRYLVAGSPRGEVTFSEQSQQGKCSCGESGCFHLVAATLMAQETGTLEEMLRHKAVKAGPLLMGVLDSAIPRDGTLKMEVTLLTDSIPGEKPVLRIGLRVGEERMYVVRSIPQFTEAVAKGEALDFGKGFSYQPEWMCFGEAETRLLRILTAFCEAQSQGVSSGAAPALRGADLRLMTLPESFVISILKVLRNLPFRLAIGEKTVVVRKVRPARLPLYWRVTGSLRGLTVTTRLPKDFLPLTSDCSYVVVGNSVVEVEEAQRRILWVLWQQQYDGRSAFEYPTSDCNRVMGELVPYLRLTGVVEIDSELEKQLIRLPLTPKVYLDKAGKEVLARTTFQYGDTEIDPFAAYEQDRLTRGGKVLLRDAAMEREVLDTLGSAGFHIRSGQVYLTGQDAIYAFVSGGVSKLQSLCEVFFSRDFRKMTPRRPNLKGQMRMTANRLELVFQDGNNDIPKEELLGILEALARHRKYFRLKDGSFLDLENMDEWQETADTLWEAAQMEGNTLTMAGDALTLKSYRACYLTSLLEEAAVPITVDDSVKEGVKALLSPQEEKAHGVALRPYQQRGYHWLRTLDKLRMGGILADDMGLGKTVQVISLLKACHLAERDRKMTSLVVAPTSLTYNWLSELQRFAPELSVMVLSGSSAQRASQIEHVKKAKDVEVLITSYPLIRRDIDLLKDMNFRFAILDEAQHIKNAGSVGAVAVKQLQAETRFALTGTPMENGTGELWSIFDFVLPGYLLNYPAFLRKYQDGQDAEDLRRRIRPFLLRRLKKDVLKDLPDKMETTLTAQMTPDQGRVYQAAMLRLKERVNTIMAEKGLGRGRTEVLAAITELRQICCHPALVLEDYTGGSGKMDMLLDILPGAIEGGHRVLLFSQFTSMLKILRRAIETAGFACMYLDGETPPARRLEMTADFNEGKGQVFLISLKAGGTGLNLTGADMVIHYDPWWNPAAEDQATDRAHRIGQTRKVDVMRLVTHGSIEEQVVDLGQRKKALFDQLITPGEEMVTALTEQDIRALFA